MVSGLSFHPITFHQLIIKIQTKKTKQKQNNINYIYSFNKNYSQEKYISFKVYSFKVFAHKSLSVSYLTFVSKLRQKLNTIGIKM